jgi:hypothetical protein
MKNDPIVEAIQLKNEVEVFIKPLKKAIKVE